MIIVALALSKANCGITSIDSLCSLNELEKFIKVSGGGLAQDVEEGDYNGLVEVCHKHGIH